MVKIYTKTGDKGETSLYGGKRVSKTDLRVEAYGTVDELNSAIGVAIAQFSIFNFQFSIKSQIPKIKKELIQIQNDLFQIGGLLASPNTKYIIHNTKYILQRVKEFEKGIDEMTKELPELRNFILPGGGVGGSHLHLARAICRRAERRIVALSQKSRGAGSRSAGEPIDISILIYLNRLSDLLFTMARFVNYKEKQKEIVWVKK